MQLGARAPLVVDVSNHTSNEEANILLPRHVDDNRVAHAARASVVATIFYLLDNTARYCAAYSWPSGPYWICVCLALFALRKAGHREREGERGAVVVFFAGRPTLRVRDVPLDLRESLKHPKHVHRQQQHARAHASPYGRLLSRRGCWPEGNP